MWPLSNAAEFYAHCEARWKAHETRIVQSVRPLGVIPESLRGMEGSGSCVLLWHRGRRYLVTAHHAVGGHTDRVVHVGTDTAWIEIRSPWINLVGAPSTLRPDAFDLAFTEIAPETAEQLDGCAFLDANATSVGESLLRTSGRGMPVVTFGYPLNGINYVASERRTHPEKVPFTGLASAEDAYASAAVDPRTHLVVDFPHDDVWIGDGVKTPRSLNGLSGGGMFSLPGITDIGNVAPPRLVAILIEHSKQLKTVVGVRTDPLFKSIDRSRIEGLDRDQHRERSGDSDATSDERSAAR